MVLLLVKMSIILREIPSSLKLKGGRGGAEGVGGAYRGPVEGPNRPEDVSKRPEDVLPR